MTAKHRKGKSNHKHEEDHLKSEVPESKVSAGGNSYTVVFFLCLVVVLGGSIGAWFCYQQHQTLSHLTDTFMSLQMKVAKLQSQETMRQTNDKVHVSDGLESRLNALEESYAQAQKQVDEALATTEQLKTSDLPAQVLSLHTEMKSRLADIQQTTVSLEQMSQLQAVLQGKAEEEHEGVKIQMGGLSQQVQTLTGRLEEADAKLEEVALLKDTLEKQAAQIIDLELQLESYLTQLDANTAEMVTLRELLPNQRYQQADVEEKINAVRISIQDHNSAALSLHSELRAQLDRLQRRVIQLVDNDQAISEPEEQTEGEQNPMNVEEEQQQQQQQQEEEKEEDANLVTTEPESDEATGPLTFSELLETDASNTEDEEPNVEEHQSNGEEVHEDDFKPDEDVASEGDTGEEEVEEGIVDAEEVESEDELNESMDA
uniref:putative uncharacterized protein DDB_G0271606 n=1 Tax=Doryrhamphus excisus TaxID=161450 RepID=UPI0025AE6F91|nr:putative uncharacterized protein DDB_G0271606 [Doryrhamphus excisus]